MIRLNSTDLYASDYRDIIETLKVWRVLHGGM